MPNELQEKYAWDGSMHVQILLMLWCEVTLGWWELCVCVCVCVLVDVDDCVSWVPGPLVGARWGGWLGMF